MRKLPLFLVMSLLLLTFAVPTFAGNGNTVVHSTETETFTLTFPVGPPAKCFGDDVDADTLNTTEITPDLKITTIVDGPQAGRVHIRGHFYGTLAVHGTDIEGSFVNHVNEHLTGDDHTFKRVVKISATDADGSEIEVLLHNHLVVQDGDVNLETVKVTCIK